jgi:hypothetical protein
MPFGTNGNWSQTAKTGANMFKDASNMAARLRADRFYGPYWMEIPAGYSEVIDDDYSAAKGDNTIRERLMKIDGLERIEVSDQMPADQIVMFQASRDVIAIADGEGIQTIQWDIYGGMAVAFKVMAIQVPVVRSTEQKRSGIVHMA